MTTLHRAVPLILFIMMSLNVFGQSSSMNTEAGVIERIINQTSIANQVTQAPKEMKKQFASNPLGLEASKNKRMIDLFAKAFIQDSLVKNVHEAFQEQYKEDLASETGSWIMSETTQKVLETEKQFHTLQGSRQRVVRMYELDKEPASEERKEIIHSLMNATSAKKSAIESQLILFRSIISAFSKLSDQQTFSESQIDGIVNNYKLQIQPQMEQEITSQFLIMYYALDNDTLREYTSFYETESGKWLSSTTSKGIHSAYKAAAQRFVESVKSNQ